MRASSELKTLSNTNIELLDKGDLENISDFKPSKNQELQNKLVKLLNEIRNPYCFLCDGIVVKVEYADTETTIEDIITSFLIRKKQE